MRKLEVVLGSAMWMALSFVMVFAALEPVRSEHAQVAQGLLSLCIDAAGSPSLLCETRTL